MSNEACKHYSCSIPGCGRIYSTKGNLSTHLRTHSGDLPHVCNECGKRFLTKNALSVHVRVHYNTRPFQCREPGCGQSFTQRYRLLAHSRIHLGQTFDCPWCGRQYTTRSDLTKHARTHTGEKPYVCSVEGCGRKFSLQFQLTRHAKTHSDSTKALAQSEVENVGSALKLFNDNRGEYLIEASDCDSQTHHDGVSQRKMSKKRKRAVKYFKVKKSVRNDNSETDEFVEYCSHPEIGDQSLSSVAKSDDRPCGCSSSASYDCTAADSPQQSTCCKSAGCCCVDSKRENDFNLVNISSHKEPKIAYSRVLEEITAHADICRCNPCKCDPNKGNECSCNPIIDSPLPNHLLDDVMCKDSSSGTYSFSLQSIDQQNSISTTALSVPEIFDMPANVSCSTSSPYASVDATFIESKKASVNEKQDAEVLNLEEFSRSHGYLSVFEALEQPTLIDALQDTVDDRKFQTIDVYKDEDFCPLTTSALQISDPHNEQQTTDYGQAGLETPVYCSGDFFYGCSKTNNNADTQEHLLGENCANGIYEKSQVHMRSTLVDNKVPESITIMENFLSSLPRGNNRSESNGKEKLVNKDSVCAITSSELVSAQNSAVTSEEHDLRNSNIAFNLSNFLSGTLLEFECSGREGKSTSANKSSILPSRSKMYVNSYLCEGIRALVRCSRELDEEHGNVVFNKTMHNMLPQLTFTQKTIKTLFPEEQKWSENLSRCWRDDELSGRFGPYTFESLSDCLLESRPSYGKDRLFGYINERDYNSGRKRIKNVASQTEFGSDQNCCTCMERNHLPLLHELHSCNIGLNSNRKACAASTQDGVLPSQSCCSLNAHCGIHTCKQSANAASDHCCCVLHSGYFIPCRFISHCTAFHPMNTGLLANSCVEKKCDFYHPYSNSECNLHQTDCQADEFHVEKESAEKPSCCKLCYRYHLCGHLSPAKESSKSSQTEYHNRTNISVDESAHDTT